MERKPIKTPADLRGMRVTVMGLGTKGGGVEVVKYLLRHKCKVKVTDLKKAEELKSSLEKINDKTVEYVLGAHREEDFIETDLVIPNPDVPRQSKYLESAKAAGVQITTDIALFFTFCAAPIAAVTGTRGKSTTVSVAGAIWQRLRKDTIIAGNILRSPLADLDNVQPSTPVVLELSSWQLEGLANSKMSPHWAVLTSLMPDHLNRYKSFDDYVSAKENIFRFQKKNDELILSLDYEKVSAYKEKAPGKFFGYSVKNIELTDGIKKEGEKVVYCAGDDNKTDLVTWDEMGGMGEHTKRNMLGGALLALRMGAPLADVREVLKSFSGIKHRLELVRVVAGRTFINDTAATIPEAVVAAINSFPNKRIILIAGGTDKNLDFNPLVIELKKDKVASLVLLKGSGTDKMLARWQDKPEEIPIVQTMTDAIREATKRSKPGDYIILSPGAASFELFKDEFDRGDQFCRFVQELKEEDFN